MVEIGYARRIIWCLSLAWLLSVMTCCPCRAAAPAPPPPMIAPAQESRTDELTETLLRFVRIPTVYIQQEPLSVNRQGWPGEFERFSANIALFRLINDHRHPWLDAVCIALLYLGSGYMLAPVTLLTGFLRRQRLWLLLAAVTLETVLVSVMKQVFAQPRPGGMLSDIYVVEELSWRAFPSGDTAMAFTLAWVLKSGLRWPARAAFIAYAVGVAYERIYLGAHFPIDVLVGAAVGILSVLLVERLFAWRTPAKPAGEPETPES